MGRAGARAGGGVDVAHVVAQLVRAQLGELGAQPHAGGAAIAREGLGDQAVDGEVQRVDERLDDRAGALPGGRGCEHRVSHALISPPALRSSPSVRMSRRAPGSGTVARTCSTSSSAVTPSESAS